MLAQTSCAGASEASAARVNGGADRRAAVADLARAGAGRKDRGADRGRVLAPRIVVGDDDVVGGGGGDRAHQRPLARIAVAAGAEHQPQPAGNMGSDRGARGGQRVGGVGIVDIDHRAGPRHHRALEPAAHRPDAGQIGEGRGGIAAGGDDQRGGDEGVRRLVRADQWQRHGMTGATPVERDVLPQRRTPPGEDAQRAVGNAGAFAILGDDGDRRDTARGGSRNHRCGALATVRPYHRRPVGIDNLGEQAQLGGEIAVHVAVIVEVIARQVGECRGSDRQPLGAKLGQSVARRFERDMAQPFAGETANIAQEGDDVGRRQSGRYGVVGGGHAERADRRRAVPGEAPQLTGQLDRRGLAVGPGDGDGYGRKGGEEPRRHPRKQPPRLGVGEVGDAVDPGRRRGDHGRGSRSDRGGNEILAVDPRSRKGAEHRARRNLAVIDGEAGHRARRVGGGQRRARCEVVEPHSFSGALATSPSMPETSISCSRSGAIPRIGAIRATILATLGAVTMPAVE